MESLDDLPVFRFDVGAFVMFRRASFQRSSSGRIRVVNVQEMPANKLSGRLWSAPRTRGKSEALADSSPKVKRHIRVYPAVT